MDLILSFCQSGSVALILSFLLSAIYLFKQIRLGNFYTVSSCCGEDSTRSRVTQFPRKTGWANGMPLCDLVDCCQPAFPPTTCLCTNSSGCWSLPTWKVKNNFGFCFLFAFGDGATLTSAAQAGLEFTTFAMQGLWRAGD